MPAAGVERNATGRFVVGRGSIAEPTATPERAGRIYDTDDEVWGPPRLCAV